MFKCNTIEKYIYIDKIRILKYNEPVWGCTGFDGDFEIRGSHWKWVIP